MEKSFTEIKILAAQGDYEALNKASLGRVYQHAQKGKFGILTAHRAELSPQENHARMEKLGHDLRSRGYGFFHLTGHWHEQQGDGTKRHVQEPSYFVPGLKLKHAKKLGARYGQDAVIHAEHGGAVALHHKSGETQHIGAFHPAKLADAYSKVKGKDFTFKAFEYDANSYVEAFEGRLARELILIKS